MRRRHAIAAAVAAAAAGGAGWAAWRATQPPAAPGLEQALWALRFERPDGGDLVAASLRGHPLLLNFWAPWCAPCVAEMPMLDQFHRDHRARGWKVLGLAIDRAEAVRNFLKKTPVGFDVALAGLPGMELARSLGNHGGVMPFTVVFDRSGQVVQRKLGPVSAQELAAWAKAVG